MNPEIAAAFITVTTIVLVVLLVFTITGRYILRKIAIALGVIAAAAIFVFDYLPG